MRIALNQRPVLRTLTCLIMFGLAGCSGQATPLAVQGPLPPPPPGTPSGMVPYGATCYAGAYTCALPASGPIGGPCSCPALGAPSYGTIR